MSNDQTREATPSPASVPPSAPNEQGDPSALGDAGKKALDAERKRAADAEREAKALRAQIEQIESAKLTDLERAQKQAADAQSDAEAARTAMLRFKIAAQYGVNSDDADLFLTGADEDTLTRQAMRLADRQVQQAKQGNYAPTEGSNPKPAEDDERAAVRSLFGGGT